MFQIDSQPLSIVTTELFKIGGIPVTNTLLEAIFNLAIFGLLCLIAQSFSVNNPGKFQLAVEYVIEGIAGFIEQIAGDRKVALTILPIVSSLILYILVSNLILTFLPFLAAFTYDGEPLFRSHTNDINTTLALAFSMVVLTQIYSIRKNGLFGYIFKFIQIDKVVVGFRKGLQTGFMAIINAMVGLLDIVSEFAKIVSLSLRLFGNMFAGELLLGIFMSMFAILLPIPIMGLSLLSGTIQALVFGALVTSYFSGVLKDD